MGLLYTTRHCLRRPLSAFKGSGACSNKTRCDTNTITLASFSSTTHRLASDSSKSKLGLGGNNWSRMEFSQYQDVIKAGLEEGVTVIEAGQEGGDRPLMAALKQIQSQQTIDPQPVTVTFRIGYHTILPTNSGEENPVSEPFPGDVPVEQHPFVGPNRTMTPIDDDDSSFNPLTEDPDQMIQIMHNISKGYIQNQLNESPLVQDCHQKGSDLKVVALLHNPEAQIMAMANEQDMNQVSIGDRQTFLRDRLVESFMAFEQAVARNELSGYGVVSNGLCLPPEHPLALSPETILEAAKLTMEQGNSNTCHLSVLQLPVNLMERTGLDIARNLHEIIQNNDEYQYLRDEPPLELFAMRPLTCYPDRGTGTGHAFRLVDYQLPAGPKQHDEEEYMDNGEETLEPGATKEVSDEELASKQWSNQMQGPPLIYAMALKKAMSHFDAEFILEEKLKRELTAEERETLDGCKLLLSLLHDLDHGLVEVRSLGAHEQDLYQRIIPLIHDTFEGYDEETADVLEMFFKSYSLAVRYSIAQNTRLLLQQGGDDGAGYKYDDLPDEEKLQDFALKYLLKEKAIDKVIVGATRPDQVVEMVRLGRRLDSE